MKVRVRFAPSPTGKLHLGNARTAIFNWLFARHSQGSFVLRIEDTDKERSKPEYEAQLIETLRWLGIDWDEGPNKKGDFGPYRQSERLHIYQEYIQRLLREEKAYYCYCTEEELETERQLCLKKGLPPRYSGKCRYLTEAQKREYEKQGRQPVIRFKVPEDEVVIFEDLIKGKMRFFSNDIGDFVIVRSNGIPAYNFAVVIDDILMQITHVVRGEDHLSNTASQYLLYKALGFTPPQFAHHSLLLAPDRTKLSKRHGAVSVEEYRKEGFLPQALFFYLATLGRGAQKEIWDRKQLVKRFDLKMAGKGNAIFDKKQLLWVNKQLLRALPLEDVSSYAQPFLPEAGKDLLKKFVALVRENVSTLKEMADLWPIFNNPKIALSKQAIEALKNPEAQMVLSLFYEALKTGQNDYEAILHEIYQKTQFKGKNLMLPLRIALTGVNNGPQLHAIFEYLPHEWLVSRLKAALNLVRQS